MRSELRQPTFGNPRSFQSHYTELPDDKQNPIQDGFAKRPEEETACGLFFRGQKPGLRFTPKASLFAVVSLIVPLFFLSDPADAWMAGHARRRRRTECRESRG
jgi:hypothetical protein